MRLVNGVKILVNEIEQLTYLFTSYIYLFQSIRNCCSREGVVNNADKVRR